MTTLISVHNSQGCVGRCDAKCYEAEHPNCDCICGGANHGAGLKQAMENTEKYAEDWVEQLGGNLKDSIEKLKCKVNSTEIKQRNLFG